MASLREYYPNARDEDWGTGNCRTTGADIKRTAKKGKLEFGTEVVTSQDGSLAGVTGCFAGGFSGGQCHAADY
ncbi:MAG: malate:quinone oxidoreductase [Thiolinea sp.]